MKIKLVNVLLLEHLKVFASILLVSQSIFGYSQFAGPVGNITTTAIHKDSSVFQSWANSCVVTRGYQDIANAALGYVNVGTDTNGIGKAGENPIVTLGDGGFAILTFHVPISDGVGADFAVFENAFDDGFLELAFVEVSSDGVNYFRFPSVSNTQTQIQIGPFDYVGDATMSNNLAGKYRALYGTPFDLDELQGIVGLNIYNVTHIKIIDVVGSVNPLYASYDSNGNAINDPYPTGFPNGGFDLDAVGVINQALVGLDNPNDENYTLLIYPNPCSDKVAVVSNQFPVSELVLIDLKGSIMKRVKGNILDLSNLVSGIYFLKIVDENGSCFIKKVIRN